VLEAARPRSGCQNGQGRALFQAADLSLYPQRGAEPGELYRASPVKALTPFIRALLHGLITAKAPTPNTTILAIRIPT